MNACSFVSSKFNKKKINCENYSIDYRFYTGRLSNYESIVTKLSKDPTRTPCGGAEIARMEFVSHNSDPNGSRP